MAELNIGKGKGKRGKGKAKRKPRVDIAKIHRKITQVREELEMKFQEREGEITALFVGLLSRQNVLLLGVPGTAKSLLTETFAQYIKVTGKCPALSENGLKPIPYFENLMHKFSTPEDIIGPLNVPVLTNEGRHERNVDGYAPSAVINFLDEIWKSGAAVLNTCLKLCNERVYYQSGQRCRTNTLMTVAASNEEPSDPSLGALNDRFILRRVVQPLQSAESFHLMCGTLKHEDDEDDEVIDLEADPLTLSEVMKVIDFIASKVSIPKRIVDLLFELNRRMRSELGYSYSDRTFAKLAANQQDGKPFASILATVAFLEGDAEVKPIHMSILRDCLWQRQDEIAEIHRVISLVVRDPMSIMQELRKESYDNYTNFMQSYKGLSTDDAAQMISKSINARDKITQLAKDEPDIREDADAVFAEIDAWVTEMSKTHMDHSLSRLK